MKIKFCPRCGNTDLIMIMGGIMGKWRCKKCRYEGIFPEKELKKEKENKMKKNKK